MKTAYLVNLKQSSSIIRGSTFSHFPGQSVTVRKTALRDTNLVQQLESCEEDVEC